MAPYNSEPFVPEPDTVIWRFMNDDKFVDLLRRFSEHADWTPQKLGKTRFVQPPGNLWLAYPSSFEDPLEGTHTAISEKPQEYIERLIAFMGLQSAAADALRKRYLTSDNQISNFNGTLCASVRLGQSLTYWSMTAENRSWNLVRPRAQPASSIFFKLSMGVR
jgi:hypothetical protein